MRNINPLPVGLSPEVSTTLCSLSLHTLPLSESVILPPATAPAALQSISRLFEAILLLPLITVVVHWNVRKSANVPRLGAV